MANLTSGSGCLSGAAPVVLASDYVCNAGFHCPNNSAVHPPEYCAPTTSCQTVRMQSLQNICAEPQGSFEPTICPPQSYCPDGESLPRCPKGFVCPLGSNEPVKCGAASICPSGSSREFVMIGFIIIVAVDMLLVLLSIWKPFKHRSRGVGQTAEDVEAADSTITVCDVKRDSNNVSDLAREKGTRAAAHVQDFVASVIRCIGTNDIGLAFGFSDLSYKEPKHGKEILAALTGQFDKGTLWGVMGSSGAGKSTFIDVLMGKKQPTTGETYVNGIPTSISAHKKIIGYVPQDDVILPELTVRENIMHSARIRLPRSWTQAQCEHHVDTLLRCLGLEHVQHNVVGDVANHAISGGQRKRVNIGMELAAAPMALFLDEPTSGLDASSALSIIKLLKELSQMGVTVICIIHQPRKEIFESLDELLLLDKGRQVYQGPRHQIVHHFQRLGYEIPHGANPADAIIDIVSGYVVPQNNDLNPLSDIPARTLDEQWRHSYPLPTSASRSSSNDNNYNTEKNSAALLQGANMRGASWYLQVYLCFLRSLKQQQRRASSFYLEIGVGAIAGLLIGLALYPYKGIHFQGIYLPPFELLSSTVNYDTVPEIGLMCCMAIGLVAAPAGVRTFGEEKEIYRREASSGHSRSAYYVGKVLSTFPRIALSSLHFTSFYTILATPSMSFWDSYATNVLYFYAIYGLASCVSVAVRREDGPLLAVILCLVMSVLDGHGPRLSTVKQWHLEWMWRMCPGTWFTEAYLDCTLHRVAHLYDISAAAQTLGFKLGQYALDLGMIFVLGSVYRVLAFSGLVFLNDP